MIKTLIQILYEISLAIYLNYSIIDGKEEYEKEHDSIINSLKI